MSDGKVAIAAVVESLGSAPVIREVCWPELEGGSMIVKVDAATICGTDIGIWKKGASGANPPYIPGHETCGSVQEIKGRRHDVLGNPLLIGDRVIWSYPFCGQCFYCSVANQPTLCDNATRFGRARFDEAPYLLGGCASHHYVPPRSGVAKVPDEVPPELAASAACALRTVVHAFERLGPVAPYEVCLIQGCGPVGLYATAMARQRGFRKVILIGAPANRLGVGRRFGAASVLNLDEVTGQHERRDWCLELTDGRGADVVIQCASASAIPEGLGLVRPGGRYLSIGGGGRNDLEIAAAAVTNKMLRVIGVRSGEARHFHSALEFLASAPVPFGDLVSGRYQLGDLGDVFARMESLDEIKPVILPAG